MIDVDFVWTLFIVLVILGILLVFLPKLFGVIIVAAIMAFAIGWWSKE